MCVVWSDHEAFYVVCEKSAMAQLLRLSATERKVEFKAHYHQAITVGSLTKVLNSHLLQDRCSRTDPALRFSSLQIGTAEENVCCTYFVKKKVVV